MNLKLFAYLVVLLGISPYSWSQAKNIQVSNSKNKNRIVICITPDLKNAKKSPKLYWRPTHYYGGQFTTADAPTITKNIRNNASSGEVLKWILTNKPSLIIQADNLPVNSMPYLLEPGDSINVTIINDEPVFTGKGAAKLNLVTSITNIQNDIQKPANKRPERAVSLEDFNEWNIYLDTLSQVITKEINKQKDKLSPFAFNYLLAETINGLEYQRLLKTMSFLNRKSLYIENLTDADRVKIFDTTLNRPMAKWLRSTQSAGSQAIYLYFYAAEKVKRDHNYNQNKIDSLSKDAHIKRLNLAEGKKLYKGDAFKIFEIFLLTSSGIKDDVGEKEMEKMLQEYYIREKDPVLKEYVKNYEKKIRRIHSREKSELLNISFTDVNGNQIGNDFIKGKIALISVSNPQHNDAAYFAIIENIKKTSKFNPHFIFLNVSSGISEEDWKKKIKEMPGDLQTIQLYTPGGPDDNNNRSLGIERYPSLYLIGKNGSILATSYRENVDLEKDFVEKVNRDLSSFQDGPYVMYENNTINAYYFEEGKKRIVRVTPETQLTAKHDELDKNFSFSLKPSLNNEPSVYKTAKKIIAISDIEGNFGPFRELLQANRVIDEKMNWIFGNGHLVLCGDFFDRGNQVTECLWLIYALEEKAKQAGGYVHFIIGNHEVMNLTGDLRYVNEKYKTNASFFNNSYEELYSEKSELGRWLCTKNIIEKIGDYIFVHGGLSKEVATSGLTIDQINAIAKRYYRDKSASHNADPNVRILFNSVSPLWFRDYYDNKNIDESYIDNILEKFGSKKIITGHTVKGKTIGEYFSGKVINIDVPHAKGFSEALLIEDNNFFRVNKNGERTAL